VSEKLQSCAYCGESLAGRDGVGRPSSYCSVACRPGGQSERQRVTRHLSRLEEERMRLRHCVVRRGRERVFADGMQLLPADRLEDVESDITALRARLHELFSRDDDE
jgi:hypothetical protein